MGGGLRGSIWGRGLGGVEDLGPPHESAFRDIRRVCIHLGAVRPDWPCCHMSGNPLLPFVHIVSDVKNSSNVSSLLHRGIDPFFSDLAWHPLGNPSCGSVVKALEGFPHFVT